MIALPESAPYEHIMTSQTPEVLYQSGLDDLSHETHDEATPYLNENMNRDAQAYVNGVIISQN